MVKQVRGGRDQDKKEIPIQSAAMCSACLSLTRLLNCKASKGPNISCIIKSQPSHKRRENWKERRTGERKRLKEKSKEGKEGRKGKKERKKK